MTDGSDDRRNRRTVLQAGLAVGTTLVAGCSGGGSDGTETDDADGDAEDGEESTETSEDGMTTEEGSSDESDGTDPTSTVVFEDDFEDGDYTSDPAWETPRKQDEDPQMSRAEVVSRSSPEGSMALQLTDMTDDRYPSETYFPLSDPISGIEGAWTLSGLFSPAEIPEDVDERRNTVTFYWPPDANFGNRAVVEFSVSRVAGGDPQLRLRTQPQENREWTEETTTAPALETDQWYRWVLAHDGEGSYVGRRWPADGTPEDAETVQTSFEAPGESVTFALELLSAVETESRSSSFQAGEKPYSVDHDHVRWVLD